MKKSITLYTLALFPGSEDVEIIEHNINEDDLWGRLSYPIEDDQDLIDAAKEKLFEEVGEEYNHQLANCVILTPEQLRKIKGWEVDWS